jgi:2-polyprenyl-3-methyl-5-hydroxy-6-metoxy-1,4-benzoquinol methylase
MLPAILLQRLRPLICPWEPLSEQVPKGSAVLDIGCGTGAFLLHLARCGLLRFGVGMDVSPRALVAARRAWRGNSRNSSSQIEFVLHEEGRKKWQPEWDVVSMIDVLHHIPPDSQREFVMAALAAVRPGGLFLYKEMCSAPWWRAGMNRLHDLVVARQWIHYIKLEQVVAWTQAAGFTHEYSSQYTRLWYGHELNLFRKNG